jgi:hypothetical protein
MAKAQLNILRQGVGGKERESYLVYSESSFTEPQRSIGIFYCALLREELREPGKESMFGVFYDP